MRVEGAEDSPAKHARRGTDEKPPLKGKST